MVTLTDEARQLTKTVAKQLVERFEEMSEKLARPAGCFVGRVVSKLQSMFTAAMLEEPNNKRWLHKNKTYFPKQNHSIVSLLQYGPREHTLYTQGILI